jgi:ATP-dependent Clp protease protease subunit
MKQTKMYKFGVRKKQSKRNFFVADEDSSSDEEDTKKNNKITLNDNHIYFHAEVNRNTIFELCEKIRTCEADNIMLATRLCVDPIPIYIHINSYGGCVFSAFHAIDVIQGCSIPVYTIIEGATASAGTLISVVGEKRFIRPNAHMLIHQLSSGMWGKMQELEDDHKNNKGLMDKIIDIYKEHASIPNNKIKDILKHDLWWNVDTCLSYGLVDELWEKT